MSSYVGQDDPERVINGVQVGCIGSAGFVGMRTDAEQYVSFCSLTLESHIMCIVATTRKIQAAMPKQASTRWSEHSLTKFSHRSLYVVGVGYDEVEGTLSHS